MKKLNLAKNKKIFKKGFTLIELLVVVALLGVLSTLVLANLNAARGRGRDSSRKADLRNIETALRLYYNDKGVYPQNNASGQILGCGASGDTACEWGEEWSVGTTVYMGALPTDPIASQVYVYTRSSPDNYSLMACLENKSDEDGIVADASECDSEWKYVVEQ